MSPSYVLRYFPFLGLAEGARMLLTAANAEWTEENPEWPAEKEKQPFGRLPVLIEKSKDGSPDFIISESPNIERYIARKYGLLPTDLKQVALQEQLRFQMTDVFLSVIALMLAKGEEDKKDKRAKFDELVDRLVKEQTRILKENGNTGRLFGSSLSYADITNYATYKNLIMDLPTRVPVIAGIVAPKLTPELVSFFRTVENDPLVIKRTSATRSLADTVST
ncbi:hypothetical protein GGF46_003839 [Coemansia sp. RSA 552]|nr:hypothetical protein GGF46_003839 [Coemansia sp. RSA 552]